MLLDQTDDTCDRSDMPTVQILLKISTPESQYLLIILILIDYMDTCEISRFFVWGFSNS